LCPFFILVQHPSGDGDEGDLDHRFQGGLQIGRRIVTKLRYADDTDIILLTTSEAEAAGSPRPSQP